jgi:sugar phosphate permease
LPFVLARIFRPTVLELYQLTNVELGVCFSIYGTVAFFSYFLGGSFADKYQPRYLMSISLLLTAVGGIYMATFPSFYELSLLYGYWGFTTIFLFWAAMIKATRVWGGKNKQGIAFGLLDGGRGAVSFGFGLVGLYIFSIFLTQEIEFTALIERQEAYKYVVLTCSALIAFVAVLVFFFIKNETRPTDVKDKVTWRQLLHKYLVVIQIRSVWLLMVIILCAYTGYKITDYYSQFANEVMGYDDLVSAQIGGNLLGIRVFIGVVVGFLADKTKSSLMMIYGFAITIIGASMFSSGIINANSTFLFWFAIILTATGVYAFRTLYFSAIQEGKIPLAVTGTAVGMISLIGYTPDIFMGPLTGYFIDNSPGLQGYQQIFGLLIAFSVIGLIASVAYYKWHPKQEST